MQKVLLSVILGYNGLDRKTALVFNGNFAIDTSKPVDEHKKTALVQAVFPESLKLEKLLAEVSLYFGYIFFYFLLLAFFANQQYVFCINNNKIIKPLQHH